ncbi:ArsR/SmtB family transcription factor [Catenulispora rubra]|uniref:ArsR/SmtB family transcription factor n=1 Tax=Catenulispora rubra TaxID=280293 RepID=UPI002264F850|nr:metalloregulator ArsR/SmtB family transcription factor [Catenulispora rubra]
MPQPGEQPDSRADDSAGAPGSRAASAADSAGPRDPRDSRATSAAAGPGTASTAAGPASATSGADHHHLDHADSAERTLPDPVVDTAVGFLDLLAEPSRLRLLWALRDGELGVSALAETAGCTPTAASQHLAKLRLGGLVEQRADGRARLYRLRGGHIRRLVEEVVGHAEHAVRGIPYDL